MVSGEKLLLIQLQYMTEGQKVIDWDDLDQEPVIKELATKFNIPDNLMDAFRAYAVDYLLDTNGRCTVEFGPFYNDEDVKDGVWSKVYYFYKPLVEEFMKQYPDLRYNIYIDASYSDASNLVITVSNGFLKGKILPCSMVLYSDSWKIWNQVSNPDPAELYNYLEACFDSWRLTMEKILATVQHYVIIHTSGGQVINTWSTFTEADAIGLARFVATDISDNIDDEIIVDKASCILEGADAVATNSTRIWSWGGGKEK